jgi:hypothetical protein
MHPDGKKMRRRASKKRSVSERSYDRSMDRQVACDLHREAQMKATVSAYARAGGCAVAAQSQAGLIADSSSRILCGLQRGRRAALNVGWRSGDDNVTVLTSDRSLCDVSDFGGIAIELGADIRRLNEKNLIF